MYAYIFKLNPLKQPKSLNRVVLIIIIGVIFSLISVICVAQNNALILSGAYIRMSGGTSGTPLYLVVNRNNALGITRTGGAIISDGEYNRVKWNMRTATGNFEFPFGTAASYTPFKFNKTTAGAESGTGSVTALSWYTAANAVWPSAHFAVFGNVPCGIATENDVTDRFWIITPSGYSTNPTADVYFYYNDGGGGIIEGEAGYTETDLRMQRWNPSCCGASTCKWETPPVGTVDATNNYVLVAGISDFSPWAMTRQSAPLPITLLYFKARWKDRQYTAVLLEWETASETNNDYFEIQRAISLPDKSGLEWAPIGTKSGAGNSSTILFYEFIDQPETSNQQPETILYYRLKQVDYDGNYTFSNIEAINAPAGINRIAIFPNPSNNYLDYLVYSAEDGTVSVWGIDAAGKLVISEKQKIKKGVNKQRLNTSHLSSGNYILQVTISPHWGAGAAKTEKQFVIK